MYATSKSFVRPEENVYPVSAPSLELIITFGNLFLLLIVDIYFGFWRGFINVSALQENAPTYMERGKKSDAREMQSFYQHYYKKYIQALQNAADKADRWVLRLSQFSLHDNMMKFFLGIWLGSTISLVSDSHCSFDMQCTAYQGLPNCECSLWGFEGRKFDRVNGSWSWGETISYLLTVRVSECLFTTTRYSTYIFDRSTDYLLYRFWKLKIKLPRKHRSMFLTISFLWILTVQIRQLWDILRFASNLHLVCQL